MIVATPEAFVSCDGPRSTGFGTADGEGMTGSRTRLAPRPNARAPGDDDRTTEYRYRRDRRSRRIPVSRPETAKNGHRQDLTGPVPPGMTLPAGVGKSVRQSWPVTAQQDGS